MEAAFLRGQKDIQREAEKKAAAQFKKDKDRYEQEMKSLCCDCKCFEEQKHLAEKVRETAEQAKALAAKEKKKKIWQTKKLAENNSNSSYRPGMKSPSMIWSTVCIRNTKQKLTAAMMTTMKPPR